MKKIKERDVEEETKRTREKARERDGGNLEKARERRSNLALLDLFLL